MLNSYYLSPSDVYFSSTPAATSALDIGHQAELYIYDQNFTAALEAFTSALNILVPLLKNEPLSPRRDLLHKQVYFSIKPQLNIGISNAFSQL